MDDGNENAIGGGAGSSGEGLRGLAAYPTLNWKLPVDGPLNVESVERDERLQPRRPSRDLNVNVHVFPSGCWICALPPSARNSAGPPSAAWIIEVVTFTSAQCRRAELRGADCRHRTRRTIIRSEMMSDRSGGRRGVQIQPGRVPSSQHVLDDLDVIVLVERAKTITAAARAMNSIAAETWSGRFSGPGSSCSSDLPGCQRNPSSAISDVPTLTRLLLPGPKVEVASSIAARPATIETALASAAGRSCSP